MAQREGKVWSTVHVPTVEQEDQRQLHREMLKLKAERTAQGNSIKGLLAGLGLCAIVDETLPTQLENLRQWDGAKLPPLLHQRLSREFQRWQLIDRQIRELEAERRFRALRQPETPRGACRLVQPSPNTTVSAPMRPCVRASVEAEG